MDYENRLCHLGMDLRDLNEAEIETASYTGF